MLILKLFENRGRMNESAIISTEIFLYFMSTKYFNIIYCFCARLLS